MKGASFTLTPRCQDDIDTAYAWYEKQQRGLGQRFLRHLQEAFRRIQREPGAYAVIQEDIRHTMVRVFPYVVFYTYHDHAIVVHAVLHGSQDEAEWQARFN